MKYSRLYWKNRLDTLYKQSIDINLLIIQLKNESLNTSKEQCEKALIKSKIQAIENKLEQMRMLNLKTLK